MKAIFLNLFIMFASTANAGVLGDSFFFEPSIGLRSEIMKLTDLSSNNTEIKMSAPHVGLKISFRSRSGLEIGVGGDYSSGKADVSTLNEKNEFVKTTTGFSLGVNSLGMVKMYLGASLSNEFILKQSPSLQEVKFSGPSYQAGLVFKLLKWLNLGVQYNLNQYTKVSGQAYPLGSRLESYFSKVDTQDYTGFISFEF